MAWLNTSAIEQKFNIGKNALAAQITSASSIAALSIREVVSSEVYAEAIGSPLDEDNSNFIRQSKVIQSHAYLTYYFLLKDSGNRFSSAGVIKEAQDSASVEGSRVITNKYLTPAELDAMKNGALSSAKFFLGDYGTLLIDEEIVVAASQNAFESTLKWF